MTVKLNTGKPVTSLDRQNHRHHADVKNDKSSVEKRPTDRVKISAFAREASQVQETTSAQDSQRAAKVAALQQQIAEGNYKPDSKDVATSLLKHILKDR